MNSKDMPRFLGRFLPLGNTSVIRSMRRDQSIRIIRCDKVLSCFVTVGKCKIACSHVQAFVGTIQKLHREPKMPFHWLTAATFGSMQLGAVIKFLAAYQKNDPGWFCHYRKGSVGFPTNLKKA